MDQGTPNFCLTSTTSNGMIAGGLQSGGNIGERFLYNVGMGNLALKLVSMTNFYGKSDNPALW
ncbi:MAG TPA: hypothetical protein DCZ43_07185 [candidate division Zixibacteria bacterium]|nr:hypothetical protein [candidate division Zixibacteria bacterium]